jgi:sulfate permease, SulP family
MTVSVGSRSVTTIADILKQLQSARVYLSSLLTVIFDLTLAVEIGMFIAIFSFFRRITALTNVSISEHSPMPDVSEATLNRKAVPEGVVIYYRVFGALFFGVADKLETILQQSHTEPDVLVLKMHEVISLEHLYGKLRNHDKHLILCGSHTQPYFLMHQAGFFERLGKENLVTNLEDALQRARELLKQN